MNRWVKYLLNSLIVFYLGLIYVTGVPETNTLTFRLREQGMKIAFALGIWPSWSMFAPNPVKFDTRTYLTVKYKNGEVKDYEVEKDPDGILSPFRKARWMKYSQDNLRNPDQKALLWPALRYFRKKHENPANPITEISIKRDWYEIEPFREQSLPSITETPREKKSEVLVTKTY